MRLAPLMLAVAVFAVPSAAAAQVDVPGAGKTSVTQDRAIFDAQLRAHVDTLVRMWSAAIERHDAKHLERCYVDDAVFVLSTGGRAYGSTAIVDAYRRMMPRIGGVRVTVGRIIANGTIASVAADVRYTIVLPTGGSYELAMPLGFGLHALGSGALEITQQEGGDLVSVEVAGAARATLAPGASDSLRVRVTDATGAGVPDASVLFSIDDGHGALSAAQAVTDAKGVAAVRFTAGAQPESNVVRARATLLPDESLLITIRTAAPAP